jgi:hypothetical protein
MDSSVEGLVDAVTIGEVVSCETIEGVATLGLVVLPSIPHPLTMISKSINKNVQLIFFIKSSVN